MRILITGASGCVGQYLIAELLANTSHKLVVIVRNADVYVIPDNAGDRVKVIGCDLVNVESILPELPKTETAILVATGWSDQDAKQVTVGANMALTDHLVANGCSKIIYFATASVLDRDLNLLPPAAEIGTDYIQAKYALVEEIEKVNKDIRIVGFYPTLILGGSKANPKRRLSHLANMMFDLKKWIWLMRFLVLDGKFHVIHAKDIAVLTRIICDDNSEKKPKAERYVLGNPAITPDDLITAYAEQLGRRRWRLIKLRPGLFKLAEKIFRMKISPWDRYCMENMDQSYSETLYPEKFGQKSHMPDFKTGLEQIGL